MKQYFEIKEKYQDTILFFRLGDFYEMFYDDAVLASKELELTLTGRDCGQEERAPMCGVPFHSAESYIARLIAKGHKVAICEQMEDPALAKGLVKREIIRVVTPGTVIESSMLDDSKNNYISSIYLQKEKAGLVFADVSTGTCHATELSGQKLAEQLIGELSRFRPSELLFNRQMVSIKPVMEYIKNHLCCTAELLEEESYTAQLADEEMAGQFGSDWPSATGIEKGCACQFAFSALLCYLKETQKKGIERLRTVDLYSSNQYMRLSPVTRANLELTETMRGRDKKGTLLWVLDKTCTAMGKRLIRTWLEQPLVDQHAINARLDAVEELYQDTALREEIADCLDQVFDLERLMTRIIYGSATPKEVLALAATCQVLPQLRALTERCRSDELVRIHEQMDPLSDIAAKVQAAVDPQAPSTLKEGGVIRKGYNSEVDELRQIVHGGKGFLTDLESRLREETGISKLKIGYNRVFGYYIEISKAAKAEVPEHFIRKQTLANAERYITEELKTLESRILGANERIILLERQLFDDLLGDIALQLSRVQLTAQAVAYLDVVASFAATARKNNYVRPLVDDGDELIIRDGRHPVVEQMTSSPFVPNDTLLDCDENRMLIITGPNMAGKSTYMRQTALICLMAQIGSFVPASQVHTGVVDSIFTRVGAADDLSAGKSTFMVEMTEVAEILENATPKSLVILDEIGRGTSTFDGMSIARAVVEYMASKSGHLGCKTLFATHYHELTDLEDSVDGVKNYNIAVKKRGDDITFLRRIVRGAADDSYGIQVSRLAGLPKPVLDRAKEVLKVLESGAGSVNTVTQMELTNYQRYEQLDAPPALLEQLRALDVDTLTPIEAMNTLYRLKKEFGQPVKE